MKHKTHALAHAPDAFYFFEGIAPNRQLAKICCDVNKPDGQFRLQADREAIIAFLKDLPVRKISGVGKVPAPAHHLRQSC